VNGWRGGGKRGKVVQNMGGEGGGAEVGLGGRVRGGGGRGGVGLEMWVLREGW